MKYLTITAEDNTHALEARDVANAADKYCDTCSTCPVAQALCRVMHPIQWFVNRDGARPKGARTYWYTFSPMLVKAIDSFDQSCKAGHPVPILGTFQIKTHADHCA